MRYTFQMQTVTEVFAGGASSQTAELRPSEFHGLMRFWFRAMMGKFVGNDLRALHRLEDAAFGSTEAAAPFVLRLSGVPAAYRPTDPVPLPVGKAYLGFPFYDYNHKDKNGVTWYRVNRPYIPAGSKFTLTLRFKLPDAQVQNVVLGSLWLLLNFGAVGGRARRGFGVVRATSAEQSLFYFLSPPQKPPADFYSLVMNMIEKWFSGFAAAVGVVPAGGGVETQTTEYDTFGAWDARIVVRDDVRSVDRWFDQWGLFLRLFRNGAITGTQPDDWRWGAPGEPHFLQGELRRTTADYQQVIAHCMDGTDPASLGLPTRIEVLPGGRLKAYLRNDVLGLPIVVHSSRRHESRTVAWHVPGEDQDRRRASPLFLRPVPLPDGRVASLCMFFIGHFLPDPANMRMPYRDWGLLELEPPEDTSIRHVSDLFFGQVKRLLSDRPDDLLQTLPKP